MGWLDHDCQFIGVILHIDTAMAKSEWHNQNIFCKEGNSRPMKFI